MLIVHVPVCSQITVGHSSRKETKHEPSANLDAGVGLGLAMGLPAWAGKPTKWEDVPKAVRDTVLANGGKEGRSIANRR
jgi:hypothetical protein